MRLRGTRLTLCGGIRALVLRFDGVMLQSVGHRAFLDRSVVHVPDLQTATEFITSAGRRRGVGSMLAARQGSNPRSSCRCPVCPWGRSCRLARPSCRRWATRARGRCATPMNNAERGLAISRDARPELTRPAFKFRSSPGPLSGSFTITGDHTPKHVDHG
jgi:hypothetical protein